MKLTQPFYIEPRRGEAHLDLNGQWDYAYTDEQTEEPWTIDWRLKTQIPSSVYWSLYHSGILPHPYEGCNSKLYDWVDHKVWYYRRRFSLSAGRAENVFLCFDGAAYYLRFWLNGILVGEHQGMFGGPLAEISERLSASGENELIVEVKAANFGAVDWDCMSSEQKQIVPWNLVRDNHTSNGDFNVVGLWQGVRLELVPRTHLSRPYLTTQSIESGKARLHLECEIADGSLNELACKLNDWDNCDSYTFAYASGNTGFLQERLLQVGIALIDQQTGSLAYSSLDDFAPYDYGQSGIDSRRYECQFFNKTFEVESPKLWSVDRPSLYLCRLELREGGQVLDRQEFEVGIRTIRTERTAGRQYRTRWGKFQFVLNGKPLFLKGMNWMPVDFLLNCSQEDYRWTLELAKEAGVQMIRVWSGGGFYESDYFYALCDRLGLMVWQDSFLANRDTPNWPQDVLQAQLCLNLYRIRNHPSLAVHSGGNEFNPYSLGNAASMAVVEREIADLDPSRPFFRTTPDQGSAHVYRDMEPVWYRRLYRQLPFLAESGIHSFPNYKSLRRLLSPQELAKPLGDLLAPDFKENHRELLNHFTEYLPQRVIRMLSRASAIERIDGIALPELIEATQMASCEFYQIMVQAMRENYPVTSGIMPWVFRRAWTTVAIQLVDGMGDPIAPYYYLKVAYQPLHILVALENLSYAPGEAVRLPVSVLNENADSSPAEAEICVLSPSLQLVYRHRESLALTGEYKQTFTAPAFVIPEDWEDRFFLIHAALRRDGKLISQSVYWPKALARLKDATLLEKFRTSPQPNLFFDKGPWLKRQIAQATSAILSCELENAQLSAGRASLTVTIRNHAAQYAFPVHLDVTEEGTVCCADDNYFLMSPGEARRLRLKIRFLDEAPTAVHVEIGAWNAAPCRLEAQLA